MSFIGLFANIASQTAVTSCMKGCAVSSSSKIINKILIPAGIFFTSWAVGDMTQDYVERDIKAIKYNTRTEKEIKNYINELKKSVESTEKAKDNVVIENVFNKEGSEDGDSTNA